MCNLSYPKSVVPKLKATLALAQADKDTQAMWAAKEEVFTQYKEVFALDRINDLTEEEFRGFLRFENNKHWTGLARKGAALLADMQKLREALTTLLDETQAVKTRLDKLIPKGGSPFLPNFGKALITAILHVTHPRQIWSLQRHFRGRNGSRWNVSDVRAGSLVQ